tara:strand:+ start:3584 stop:3844 length:261 start_codon:yes stop_codon:yes gene_type:complete
VRKLKGQEKKGLTGREQETLVYMLMGLNSYVIADKMEITPNTVRTMLVNIYKFFKVSTREAVMGLFIDKGLLQIEVDNMLKTDKWG